MEMLQSCTKPSMHGCWSTNWGQNKMADISQMTISKSVIFCFKFNSPPPPPPGVQLTSQCIDAGIYIYKGPDGIIQQQKWPWKIIWITVLISYKNKTLGEYFMTIFTPSCTVHRIFLWNNVDNMPADALAPFVAWSSVDISSMGVFVNKLGVYISRS